MTIDELADRVLALTGSGSEIVRVPYDEVYGQGIEDMLHRQPAIEKVAGAIGWQPTRSLDQILGDVLQYTRHSPFSTSRSKPSRARPGRRSVSDTETCPST